MKRTAFALALTLASSAAAADCFDSAGADFGINPMLLRAIAQHESGNRLDAINRANRDGSEDLCAMQINSQHLPLLSQAGISREDLLTDRCTCIYAGAYILAGEIRAGGDNWTAVARYNVGRKGDLQIGRAYAAKVRAQFLQLTRRQPPAAVRPRLPLIEVRN